MTTITNDTNVVVQEGKAKVTQHGAVFYNKVQEFNRDLSVLAVQCYLKNELWKKKGKNFVKNSVTILDALSATGLRSFRYALECTTCSLPVQIIANDISDAAIETIQANIELNGVTDKVIANSGDATMVMHRKRVEAKERFTVIDLDPYGSPAPFIDAAVQAIVDGGLLMVTCTDMAVLCGNHGETCYAKYGAFPVKAKFCHEMALRVLLQSIQSHAARYGRYIIPLLSLSIDFYVRIFLQVFTSPFETRKCSSKLAYINICAECESFSLQPMTHQKSKTANNLHFVPARLTNDCRCKLCGGELQLGGPIWSDPIHDSTFIELMQNELSQSMQGQSTLLFGTARRMQGILAVAAEELPNIPLYYQLDRLCALSKCRMPPIRLFRSAIINAGHSVSYSHALKNSVKTTAPNELLWAILKQLVANGTADKSSGELKQSDPASRIFSKTDLLDQFGPISLTQAEGEEPASKTLNLLRYQLNPEEDWGPKARPDNSRPDKRKLNQNKHFINKQKKTDDNNNNGDKGLQ